MNKLFALLTVLAATSIAACDKTSEPMPIGVNNGTPDIISSDQPRDVRPRPASSGMSSDPNNPNGGYHNGPTPGGYPGSATSSYRQLAPPDVDALVKTVQGRIAEASKLSAAKDGLAQRSLRADDLSRLLRGISSEACRVDLATFAYSHVSDPENFNRVYAAFETESGPRTVEAAVNSPSQR